MQICTKKLVILTKNTHTQDIINVLGKLHRNSLIRFEFQFNFIYQGNSVMMMTMMKERMFMEFHIN